MESRRKERDIELKISNKGHLLSKLKDLEAKIKIYESAQHENLLQEYQRLSIAGSEIINVCQQYNSYIETITNKINDIPDIALGDLEDTIDNDSYDLTKKYIEDFEKGTEFLKEAVRNLKDIRKQYKRDLKDSKYNVERRTVNKQYKQLVKQLSEAGIDNPGEYGTLIKEKQNVEKELREIKLHEDNLSEQLVISKDCYRLIQSHEKQLRDERKKVADKWNKNNEDIVITVEELGDLEDAEKSFRKIIRKEDQKTYSKYICDTNDEGITTGGLVYEIINSPSKDRWNVRTQIIKTITSKAVEREKQIGKVFSRHIDTLKEETPEDIDRLYTWFPDDKIALSLIENGKKESIENGSAGERTAAMLSLLLSIDDSPIIIDQPEDDLDTSKISSLVVQGLRKLKDKQQVIVVTHNPNIPVNGGAEQIIQMNYANGGIWVKNSGALQNQTIRQAVCDVMEGGSEALNNRYYRISKALEYV